MTTSGSTPSPLAAFGISIAIFIGTVIAVVVLWALVGELFALIVLSAAFVALFCTMLWAFRTARTEMERSN